MDPRASHLSKLYFCMAIATVTSSIQRRVIKNIINQRMAVRGSHVNQRGQGHTLIYTKQMDVSDG